MKIFVVITTRSRLNFSNIKRGLVRRYSHARISNWIWRVGSQTWGACSTWSRARWTKWLRSSSFLSILTFYGWRFKRTWKQGIGWTWSRRPRKVSAYKISRTRPKGNWTSCEPNTNRKSMSTKKTFKIVKTDWRVKSKSSCSRTKLSRPKLTIEGTEIWSSSSEET